MTIYNVHLYREMRLTFGGIEADSPESAAAIARERPDSEAAAINGCDGEHLAALVDVAGDDDFRLSKTIDYEGERLRNAAPLLLEALERAIHELELWQLGNIKDEGTETAIRIGKSAIDQAISAGIRPNPPGNAPRFDFTHDPDEDPDRAYVLVDGSLDMAIIRSPDGIIIDLYPKDWIDPIDSLTVWDDDIASSEPDAPEASEAEEA